MRNLLSLDGGGIRGFFSLQILARIEQLLREHFQRPQMVLADYFDYMGGVSTGAIIAGMLSWGYSVEEVIRLYHEQAKIIFGSRNYRKAHRSKYDASAFSDILKALFSEDGAGKEPALLGTDRLRTRYLCVMRNASTGSTWVITNSRGAKFNDPSSPECNLNIPLYRLIRASSAAPFYFPPESISAGEQKWVFLDGGLTPYGNPAFLMYLTTTLSCFGDPWLDGSDNLRIISVGTGRYRTKLPKVEAGDVHLLDHAIHAIPAMIDSVSVHQDLACRAIGKCLYGEPIDLEVGDMIAAPGSENRSRERFLYCRYNHEFSTADLEQLAPGLRAAAMDDLTLIPFYEAAGAAFAQENVKAGHLI